MKVPEEKLEIFRKPSERGFYRDEQERISIFNELINSEKYTNKPMKEALASLPDEIQVWWMNRY